MVKHLSVIPILMVILAFGCHNKIIKRKSLLKPRIVLDYGNSIQLMTNGLITEFKKIESDSFALIFFFENDSTGLDSLPTNVNEIILDFSIRSLEVDSSFRLVSTRAHTKLYIRSIKSNFDSIFDQSISIIYNQSFDSSLIKRNGISPESLQRYHSDKFATSRMACVIVGNFEFEYIESLIERYFNDKTVGIGSMNHFNFQLDSIFFNNTGSDTTKSDGLKSG